MLATYLFAVIDRAVITETAAFKQLNPRFRVRLRQASPAARRGSPRLRAAGRDARARDAAVEDAFRETDVRLISMSAMDGRVITRLWLGWAAGGRVNLNRRCRAMRGRLPERSTGPAASPSVCLGKRAVAPCDPTSLPFTRRRAVVDAIWSDMGCATSGGRAAIATGHRDDCRANRLSILLADRTPSWCVLHELAHAMTSHADGRSDGRGPLFMGVYLQLIVCYLRLDPRILIDSLRMRGSRSPATRVRCSSIPTAPGMCDTNCLRRASAAVSCTLTSRNERSSGTRLRHQARLAARADKPWRRLRPTPTDRLREQRLSRDESRFQPCAVR